MEWFKKHVDAVMVLGGILGAMVWMNGEFNEIKKDIAVIKAVLVMKEIMPRDLAVREE